MKTIRKNRKEDLKLLIDLGENYHGEDVTFTFSAGRYGVEKYVCSYINGEAVNLVVNGTAMLCLLDNHRLPLGTLSVEIDIRVPDTQMPDGDFRHVTRKAAAFSISSEQCTVELTNGASDYFPEELVPEAVINLLPTVIKGDPGQDADIEGCNQAIAAMVALTGDVEMAESKRAEAEQQAQRQKIREIDAYNDSDSVNGFFINGQKVWVDAETRVKGVNGAKAKQTLGAATMSQWLGGQEFTLAPGMAVMLYAQIESYALDCQNVTEAHKSAVLALNTVEEVEAYDITQGYPEMLTFTI